MGDATTNGAILLLLRTVLLHVEHVGDSRLLPIISSDRIRRSVMTVLTQYKVLDFADLLIVGFIAYKTVTIEVGLLGQNIIRLSKAMFSHNYPNY